MKTEAMKRSLVISFRKTVGPNLAGGTAEFTVWERLRRALTALFLTLLVCAILIGALIVGSAIALIGGTLAVLTASILFVRAAWKCRRPHAGLRLPALKDGQ